MTKDIWLRTSAYIPEPRDASNSGESVVFYHLYETMRSMGVNVVLNEPRTQHLELWWGWNLHPSQANNPKALFTLGESYLEVMEHWQEFDHIFLATKHGKERQHVPKPLSVWHLGIDPEMFPVLERNNPVFSFAHVGTPQIRKGSDIACRVFADLFFGEQDARLVIHAPDGGGDYKELQEEYSECQNIQFLPVSYIRQDTWKHFTDDCLVFPSLREGWGLCLTEALSTGMPAIVSRLPVFDNIFNENCGWWIDMDTSTQGVGYGVPDLNSLRQKMIYAYEHQDEVKSKGRNAARFVRDNLTWEQGIREGFIPVAEEYGWL